MPPCIASRLISLLAYDQAHTIVHAEVVAGMQAGEAIERVFSGNAAVSYIYLHNARQGCYSCLAERAQARRQPSGSQPCAAASAALNVLLGRITASHFAASTR